MLGLQIGTGASGYVQARAITGEHTQPKPFIWTKNARDILQKVIRANNRSSSKQNAAHTTSMQAAPCYTQNHMDRGVPCHAAAQD